MIFLRYESFREYLKLYPVTSILLGLNILIFILVSLSGGSRDNETLIQFGALVSHPEFSGQLWRYVTSMFIHIGFDHLLFNGFALFVFAPAIERLLGKLKFVGFYIGSGIVGNVVSMMLMKDLTISAGASGAIYGIFGAFMYLVLFRKDVLDQQSRKTILIILIVGVVYSLIMPGVNLYAHFGGFLGGLILFAGLNKVR